MSEWKSIDTAPLKQTLIVGRHDCDAVSTVYWISDRAKILDLTNWVGPPTHWLDGIELPPQPNPIKQEE